MEIAAHAVPFMSVNLLGCITMRQIKCVVENVEDGSQKGKFPGISTDISNRGQWCHTNELNLIPRSIKIQIFSTQLNWIIYIFIVKQLILNSMWIVHEFSKKNTGFNCLSLFIKVIKVYSTEIHKHPILFKQFVKYHMYIILIFYMWCKELILHSKFDLCVKYSETNWVKIILYWW